MKRVWALAAIFLSAAVVTAAVRANSADQRQRAPEPLKPIDVSRFFTGRWYEIARTPMKITNGCVAGTTDYFNDSHGRLIDKDACREATPAGKEKVFQGPVTILNPGQNNKVSVRYSVFFGIIPATRTYWMLDHGDDYDWFIVSDPEFKNLSFFTRSPRPSSDEVSSLTAKAKGFGYDTSLLEYPTQFPPGQE